MFRNIFLAIFLFSGVSFITAVKKTGQREISEKEAIILAENFIKVNGYTKSGADETKVQTEFLYDDGESVKSILKKRYNTLYQKAFCISKEDNGWSIGFLSTAINIKKLDSIAKQRDLDGRAVKMNLSGTEIKMEHKDPLFSKWRKLSNY